MNLEFLRVRSELRVTKHGEHSTQHAEQEDAIADEHEGGFITQSQYHCRVEDVNDEHRWKRKCELGYRLYQCGKDEYRAERYTHLG